MVVVVVAVEIDAGVLLLWAAINRSYPPMDSRSLLEAKRRYAHKGEMSPRMWRYLAEVKGSSSSRSETDDDICLWDSRRHRTLGDYVNDMGDAERVAFRSAQEIVPGVYLGPQTAALWSWRENFTHYLSMNGNDATRSYVPRERKKTIEMDDDPRSADALESCFEECIQWINDVLTIQDAKILIYCTAGRSRSASIVIAFLMRTRGMVLYDALERVRRRRPWIQPNPGFVRALLRWELRLFQSRTIRVMPHCELCSLKRRTRWIEEHPRFVILECDQCDQPMAVWRDHTMSLSEEETALLESALRRVAKSHFGSDERYYIDKRQRTIFTHLHWHARKHTAMSRALQAARTRMSKI